MIISKSFTEITYSGTLQEIAEAAIARKLAPNEKVSLRGVFNHEYITNSSLMLITITQPHVDNETPA